MTVSKETVIFLFVIPQRESPIHGTPFFLYINFFTVLEKKGDDLYVTFGSNSLKLPKEKAEDPALKEYVGQEVVLGIRPECIHDDAASLRAMSDSVIETDVEVTELMGSEIYLYLVSEETNMIARVSNRSTARAGDIINVAFDMSRVHIFDKDTERYIVH